MKNITLSADERVIEEARAVARQRRTTLNAAFREWLHDYTGRKRAGGEYRELFRRLDYVRLGKARFGRDEMNER